MIQHGVASTSGNRRSEEGIIKNFAPCGRRDAFTRKAAMCLLEGGKRPPSLLEGDVGRFRLEAVPTEGANTLSNFYEAGVVTPCVYSGLKYDTCHNKT